MVKANRTYKVAHGWSQVPGQDCGSTFAPVCRLQSVRTVLAIAAEMDWEVRQLDVKTAFLHADIEEEGKMAKNVQLRDFDCPRTLPIAPKPLKPRSWNMASLSPLTIMRRRSSSKSAANKRCSS